MRAPSRRAWRAHSCGQDSAHAPGAVRVRPQPRGLLPVPQPPQPAAKSGAAPAHGLAAHAHGCGWPGPDTARAAAAALGRLCRASLAGTVHTRGGGHCEPTIIRAGTGGPWVACGNTAAAATATAAVSGGRRGSRRVYVSEPVPPLHGNDPDPGGRLLLHAQASTVTAAPGPNHTPGPDSAGPHACAGWACAAAERRLWGRGKASIPRSRARRAGGARAHDAAEVLCNFFTIRRCRHRHAQQRGRVKRADAATAAGHCG